VKLKKKSLLFHRFDVKSSHDGFVFSIPLMIGIAFIIFAALIGISQGFVEVGGTVEKM